MLGINVETIADIFVEVSTRKIGISTVQITDILPVLVFVNV
jgi:hypothetical protein